MVLARIEGAVYRWFNRVMEKRIAASQARIRDLQAKEDDNFLRLLGIITRDWALVEVYLDLCNFYGLNTAEGASLATELPRSLNPKIDLFKKIHRRISNFLDLETGGAALAARIVALRSKRHDLIHGMVSALESPHTRPRRIQRLILSGTSFEVTQRDYSMDEIVQLAGEVSALAADLHAHQQLIAARFDDQGDDALG